MTDMIRFLARFMGIGMVVLASLKILVVGCVDYPSGASPRAFLIAALACFAVDSIVGLAHRAVTPGAPDRSAKWTVDPSAASDEALNDS